MLSLNARIVLSASLVLAVFIALTGYALDQAFRDSAREARQDRLLGQVYLLIAAAEVDSEGRLEMPETLSESRFSLPGSGLYGIITGPDDLVLWRSPSTAGAEPPYSSSLQPGEQKFEQVIDRSGEPFFVQSLGVSWAAGAEPQSFTFSVTENLSAFYDQLRLYRQSLWGWLGGMALLLLATQALVLRWGLRPLRSMAGEITAIETGSQEQVEGSYPDELKRLTDNLNALLHHERAQQKRYRDALADLAHSLKTPLSVMRGALTEQQDREHLHAAVEDQVARMNRIVEYQLQRAATAGRSQLASPVAVKPIASKIIESLNKVYFEKSVSASMAIADGVQFRGDEGDLTELIGNLLDNAYKWSHTSVRVTASHNASSLILGVEDDGPGIDERLAARVLERGVRADEAAPGHGIGLAVVRDIVDAYGGEMEVGRGELGGAVVRLKLPAG
jgi:two-component system sensor histidine kinase PhoQ